MLESIVVFESHPMYLTLCAGAAALGTYLLYHQSDKWTNNQKWILSSIRFIVLFVIAALLIAPIIRYTKNHFEKPVVVFAIDNSTSISSVLDSLSTENLKNRLKQISTDLIKDDKYEIELRTLSNSQTDFSKINFTNEQTDLTTALKSIENDFENRNLAHVILVSDGLYNSGLSPTYANYEFSISTIGVGDTLPKNDILIRELKYNKISYQGNKIPIRAKIANQGYKDQKINIQLLSNGRVVDAKSITPVSNAAETDVEFIVEAQDKGLQRFVVLVENKEGEFNTKNNIAQAYVDVIDGKEQILMIAAAPHPDIKAIRSAIESNSNYEFNLFIPGLHPEPSKKYDLVIYHQFPDRRNVLLKWFDKYNEQNTPSWIITSASSNYGVLNQKLPYLNIQLLGAERDAVAASFNDNFGSFIISEELKQLLSEAPPLSVPFSKISTNVPVMLYQKIGTVTTRNPLLLLAEIDNAKSCVLLSDGIWQWRLFEYAKYESHDAFNELITKMVQFLSTRQDKRKFKFYTVNSGVGNSDQIAFEAETYNDIYEPIYDKEISLELTNDGGVKSDYSFITSPSNSRFKITGLPEGVYKYVASTDLQNKKELVQGEFVVENKNIESLNLTANHDLLQLVAQNSGGTFYTLDNIDKISEDIHNENSPEIIHTEESFMPIINLPYLFFLILMLLSAEWFFRKYSGQY